VARRGHEHFGFLGMIQDFDLLPGVEYIAEIRDWFFSGIDLETVCGVYGTPLLQGLGIQEP